MNGNSVFRVRRLGRPVLVSGVLPALMLTLLLLAASAGAQTAHFSYAKFPLGAGLLNPSGVAVDGSGNVYVADTDNNAVKEIPAGCVSPGCVRNLGGGFDQPGGVAVDGGGNVYVADTYNSAVKEIPPSCATASCVKTLGHGFSYPSGVAVDGSDNVFVADTLNDAVKEILAAGGYTTVKTIGSGFSYPEGVAVDSGDWVYVADTGNNAVKEIAAGGYTTVVTLGQGFSRPEGIARDRYGNIFVADSGNNALKELQAGAFTTTTILSGGYPSGVAVDGSGNVVAADSGDNQVIKLDIIGVDFGTVPISQTSVAIPLTFTFDSGGSIGSLTALTQGAASMEFAVAGGGTCKAGTYIEGATCTMNVTFTPTLAGLRSGAVFLKNSSGNIFATGHVHGIGSGPQVTFLPGSQSTLGGGFNSPGGVAVDGNGNVFVADTYNHAVKEIPPGCVTSGCVKTVGSGFNLPAGVAVDGGGNLFVADAGKNALYEILAAGGYTTVNTFNLFDSPGAVAVDASGNVFVAYSGFVSGIVWSGGSAGGQDGVNTPIGVAVDGSGNIFVTGDWAAYEISEAGLTVPLGNEGHWFGGVAVDGNGNVFISDAYGLQEIVKAGPQMGTKTLSYNCFSSVAVDGRGNLYGIDGNQVTKVDYADAPSLSFGSTNIAASGAEQTVTLVNSGNAPLTFPSPATGRNPSVAPNFTLDSSASTACPVIAASAAAKSLVAGASCTLSIGFDPTAAGNISGSVVVKDNALNAASSNYAVQTIGLHGTGNAQQLQTIAFPTPGAQSYGVAPIMLKASASSMLPVSYTVTSGPAKVSGNTLTITGAGTVVVQASQGGNSGYIAATPVTASIAVNKAVLTVTANNVSRVYGTANPALTYTIKGYKNADTSSVLAGAASLTTAATAKSGVGAAPITFATKGLTAWNYSIVYVNGSLTVTKAVLTVKATSVSRIYGTPNPMFTYTITGFVNGDTNSVISGAASLAGATPATVTSAIGSYPIMFSTEGLTAANYSFTYVSGTLTVVSPLPTVTSLSPNSATAGGLGFTLTVSGTNFAPPVVVKWGSTTLTTTYASAAKLTAVVPKTLIAKAGTAKITVTTAKGTSAAATFTIK